MVFSLYNTLTHKVAPFETLHPHKVGMYVCGPTVYNYAHIGNFRTFVATDLLRRTLKHKGFDVTHVMNLTDVDDKTIFNSQKEGKSLIEFTTFYADKFFEDFKTLHIETPEHVTKATDFITGMITLIQTLIEKGFAYEKNGSVYYAINSFASYGELVGLAHADLKDNADGRLNDNDEYNKEHARDFALWKAYEENDGEVFWESPWGKGRPGWHIECSVMSTNKLGPSFDLHAGGVDLKFPHHTNEIAQAEAATNKQFCHNWFHVEFLIVEGEKMSKSLGNFYTIPELLSKGYDGRSIRYVLLSTHYRQKLNFTFDGLDAATKTIARIDEFLQRMFEQDGDEKADDEITKATEAFEKSLDDDINISGALAALHDFMREINKKKLSMNASEQVRETMYSFDEVLGLNMKSISKGTIDEEVEALIQERNEARANKEWVTSDRIRDELAAKGIELLDGADGTTWRKK